MTETGAGQPDEGPDDLMEKVVRLCRHRGFIFPSAEIYGGFRSTYDYGPLGVNMLRNVKDAWWRSMVQLRDDVVGLDAAILGPPAVWEASGHLATFTDPLVDCRNCHERWRADKIDGVCPNCGSADLTEARAFNLMFKTHAGPVEDEGPWPTCVPRRPRACSPTSPTSCRPRARSRPSASPRSASRSATRSPRRTSSFAPASSSRWRWSTSCRRPRAQRWFEYWLERAHRPGTSTSACPQNSCGCATTTPTSSRTTRAGTADVEFLFPWGWDELEGIANRTDYDLKAHAGASGESLDYFDQARPTSATCPTSSSRRPGPPAR